MVEYLKVDSTRITFGEYWRWKPGFAFVYLAFRKVVGWKLPATLLIPAQPGFRRLTADQLPATMRAALSEAIAASEAWNCELVFFYDVPTLGPHVGFAAALSSRDRLTLGLVTAASLRSGGPIHVGLHLASRLRDGRVLATGDGGTIPGPPPEVDALSLRGACFGDVLDAHAARVLERRNAILPVDDAAEFLVDLQRYQLRFNRARGIYVPATPQDIRRFS